MSSLHNYPDEEFRQEVKEFIATTQPRRVDVFIAYASRYKVSSIDLLLIWLVDDGQVKCIDGRYFASDQANQMNEVVDVQCRREKVILDLLESQPMSTADIIGRLSLRGNPRVDDEIRCVIKSLRREGRITERWFPGVGYRWHAGGESSMES